MGKGSMIWEAKGEDLRTTDGRFEITDRMIERGSAATCSLLERGRWVRDFESKRLAKAWAANLIATGAL